LHPKEIKKGEFMQAQSMSAGSYSSAVSTDATVETQRSGVSWSAIFAGAAAAAALSLVLFLLGSGLGFSALSPWENHSGVAIGVSTILWIGFTQLAASAVGGYMAGRLRVKWASVHTDEVYFRDTAHGLLAWAVATLVTALLFTSVLTSALSGAASAGAGVAKATMATGGVAATAAAAKDGGDSAANPVDYFADMLLRSDRQTPDASGGNARTEIVRIFANGLHNGSLAADDRSYLAQVVAARTGLAAADAEKRVDEVYKRVSAAAEKAKASAREAADKARKAAAVTALWMTAALLLGAFVASLCATFGGKLRDGIAAPRSVLNR
jgi:hypothetical protein